MNIFYIHGFNSGGGGSTANLLAESFPGAEVFSFTYRLENPMMTMEQLISDLGNLELDKTETVVIGTSLGGFWAEYINNALGYNTVVVNPSRTPFEGLRRYLGKNKNFVTGIEYELTEETLDLYKTIDLFGPGCSPRWPMIALLYEGDTIVDAKKRYEEMKDFCDARLLPGGEHRLTKAMMSDVVKAVNDVLNCVPG